MNKSRDSVIDTARGYGLELSQEISTKILQHIKEFPGIEGFYHMTFEKASQLLKAQDNEKTAAQTSERTINSLDKENENQPQIPKDNKESYQAYSISSGENQKIIAENSDVEHIKDSIQRNRSAKALAIAIESIKGDFNKEIEDMKSIVRDFDREKGLSRGGREREMDNG